jgi:hypothetical protein
VPVVEENRVDVEMEKLFPMVEYLIQDAKLPEHGIA